jgi:hypothetical protein
VRTRPRLDLTPQEFERRLAAHAHDGDEIRRLWEELAVAERAPEERRLLGLGAVVALHLGLLLVVAASVSLLLVNWDDLGAWGVLALAGAYLVGYLVTGEIARRRELAEAADVLEAVAVGWVAVVAYAAQELTGVWPEGASDSASIHRGLTTIAVVAVAAGLLLLALRPDPLLFVPIAAATAVPAVDLADALAATAFGIATAGAGASPPDDLQAVKAASARYHSLEQALRDGYTTENEPCVSAPPPAGSRAP